MSQISVDARGRSCPEPVLMTIQAMKSNQGAFEVLVDNQVAIENIKRCCGSKGYAIEVVEDGEDYRLKIKRK